VRDGLGRRDGDSVRPREANGVGAGRDLPGHGAHDAVRSCENPVGRNKGTSAGSPNTIKFVNVKINQKAFF
jgi:hypothetical protein